MDSRLITIVEDPVTHLYRWECYDPIHKQPWTGVWDKNSSAASVGQTDHIRWHKEQENNAQPQKIMQDFEELIDLPNHYASRF